MKFFRIAYYSSLVGVILGFLILIISGIRNSTFNPALILGIILFSYYYHILFPLTLGKDIVLAPFDKILQFIIRLISVLILLVTSGILITLVFGQSGISLEEFVVTFLAFFVSAAIIFVTYTHKNKTS